MSSHETFTGGEIEPPSPRATGFVFAGVAALLAYVLRETAVAFYGACAASLTFLALSLAAPRLLQPLNLLWFRFSLLLNRIVSPVLMLVIFAIVFVPAGFIMRRWHDPLRVRRNPGNSYWIDRQPDADRSSSMANQF